MTGAGRAQRSPIKPLKDCFYSRETVRNRSALAITLTEDKAIAAAAMIGDNSNPNIG